MSWEELDEHLVEELRQDPRASIVTLAQRVYAPRAVVSERLRCLTSHDLVRVVAAVHPGFLGLRVIAHVSILTSGPTRQVTEMLVEWDSCVLVSITAGEYDIVAELRVSTHGELQRELDKLRAHPVVVHCNTVLYTEIIQGNVEHTQHADIVVDQVDRRILAALIDDGRVGWKALAEVTGKSPSAVRNRVQRLLDARIAQLVVVQQRGSGSNQVSAGVGVTLHGDTRSTLTRLIDIDGIEFAAASIGRFDAVLTVRGSTPMAIDQSLEKVRADHGVRSLVTWLHLRSAKVDYARMGMISNP